MHIHYKNIKSIAENTKTWVDNHLSHLGIDIFGCNVIDLKDNTYLPMACHYDLYCEYIEKKHHLNMASRLQHGLRYWSAADPLYQLECQFRAPEAKLHMLDWTLKTKHGFEMYVIVGHHELQLQHFYQLKHWIHAFSYQALQVKKYKPKALLELENRDVLLEKHLSFDDEPKAEPFVFQKARFGDLVLTGKEQAYIQHLVLKRPYKDIAAGYQVSEMAVHKAIYNIKCKLGSPTMTLPDMLAQLNACGVLGACMQTVCPI
jgi:hypothetical protein